MFASTVLNYMDRQAIALVGPQIKAQFALDNQGYGWVMAAFQLTYAFFQWPAGYLADRWNVRRTYAAAVTWWSGAGIATAFAPNLGLLMTFRGTAWRGRIVQLAVRFAGHLRCSAPVRSKPGQRYLQLGSCHRSRAHAVTGDPPGGADGMADTHS